MHTDRFDAIAIELNRLANEIIAINAQPFDPMVGLQPTIFENADHLQERDDANAASSASVDLMYSPLSDA
jgi:hypothetical protein